MPIKKIKKKFWTLNFRRDHLIALLMAGIAILVGFIITFVSSSTQEIRQETPLFEENIQLQLEPKELIDKIEKTRFQKEIR